MTTITHPQPDQITIRLAHCHDRHDLRVLAQLDSAAVPGDPVLLAEVGGELRAALSLRDGEAVADPFVPTAHLVALLNAHAEQLRAQERRASRDGRLPARAAAAVLRGLRPRRRDVAVASSPQAWLRTQQRGL
jgi:hypothetical protein